MSPSTRARLQLLGAALLFSTGGAAIKAAAFTGWQIASLSLGVRGVGPVADGCPARGAAGHRRRCWSGCLRCLPHPFRAGQSADYRGQHDFSPVYRAAVRTDPGSLAAQGARAAAGHWVHAGGRSRSGTLLRRCGRARGYRARSGERGNLLALVSGFFWALTVCGLRWLSAKPGRGSPIAAVTSGNLTAFLVTLPFALPFGSHSSPTGRWWCTSASSRSRWRTCS